MYVAGSICFFFPQKLFARAIPPLPPLKLKPLLKPDPCRLPDIIVRERRRRPNGYHVYNTIAHFFPDRATSHTKKVTNPNFGYPDFWGTKIAVQRPSDRLRVGCPHSADSELCGHTRQYQACQPVPSCHVTTLSQKLVH